MLGSLVSEWTFDEGGQGVDRTATNADVKDSWGNNHGVVHGNPQVKGGDDCVYGRCMSFDGSGYIDCGKNADLAIIEKTISLWIKTDISGVGIVGQNGGSGQWLLTIMGNKLAWDTWATGPDMRGVTNIVDNKWHHLVIVISAVDDKTIFYLDSKIEKSDSGLVITPVATGNLFIASCDLVAGDWCSSRSLLSNFKGLVDDVRIYNSALFSAQIKQNYIAGLDSMLSKGSLSKDEYNERIQALANH